MVFAELDGRVSGLAAGSYLNVLLSETVLSSLEK